MPSSSLQAVLLDMGGVILRMAGGHGFPHARLDWRGRQAMLHALGKGSSRVTLDDLESLVFGPWRAEYDRREQAGREADWSPHLERLRSESGSELSDRELLAAWFRPYGEQLLAVEGAREVLEEMQDSGLKLALVSNVPLPGDLYLEVLERHGLERAFQCLCFSYDRGSRKPSPALLRQAMTEVGSPPGATVMVGDRRERDVAAGKSAGVGTVWIRGADDGGPAPDETIGSLTELPDLLRQWHR